MVGNAGRHVTFRVSFGHDMVEHRHDPMKNEHIEACEAMKAHGLSVPDPHGRSLHLVPCVTCWVCRISFMQAVFERVRVLNRSVARSCIGYRGVSCQVKKQTHAAFHFDLSRGVAKSGRSLLE